MEFRDCAVCEAGVDCEVFKNKGGYGVVSFKGKSRFAHRVVYELLVGEIPRGADVCHSCDNRRCINPKHLFTGTRMVNMQDALAKGRMARGEMLPQTKLTVQEIIEIRFLRECGAQYKELSGMFGVSKSSIANIITRKNWGWVNA